MGLKARVHCCAHRAHLTTLGTMPSPMGYVPGKKSRGYRPKPRKDIPKIVYGVDGVDPEGGEDGIRYHPDTGHDKYSRFMKHSDCSVSWLCADPKEHGLANSPKNRVYKRSENFCYTEDEISKKKTIAPHDPKNEIQVRFKGNSIRGSNSNGVRVILETKDSESIRSIKERIQDQMLDRDADRDYAPDQQLLFFEDLLLEDDKTIGDYGIKMHHTINAEMRCGFGTSSGLFTTVAEYEWNEHRGFETNKRGEPILKDGYGWDTDSRYLPEDDGSVVQIAWEGPR